MKLGGFFIALAFALAACSSDPQPREPDPTSTTRPSSTATPPTMPAQASEDSPEGAAAFVNYWISVLNHALSTGKTGELDRISGPQCSGCGKYADLINDTYAAGGSITGNAWTPGRYEIDFGEPQTYLTTTISISAGESRRTSTAETTQDRADQETMSFAVDDTKDGWLMTQVALGGLE